jgi:hypothetical protein
MCDETKDEVNKSKINDSQMSRESLDGSLNRSQIMVKSSLVIGSSKSITDSKVTQYIKFKNEGQCLDYLLDNFQHN